MKGQQTVYLNLHCIPLLTCFFVLTSLFGAYIVAYLYGHIDLEVTIVSDALNFPPESCIFGYGLDIASAIMVLKVYLRYCQLVNLPSHQRPPVNFIVAGFWSGLLSAFGTSIVGGFQLSTMPVTHWIGATLAFTGACVYSYMQTICTSYASPNKRCLVYFRLFLAITQSLSFVLTLIGVNAAYLVRGEVRTLRNKHIGYEWTMLGAISEWTLCICTALFQATFALDFKDLQLMPPMLVQKTSNVHMNGKIN